jgi:small glutamine-rich tetratricopeptide repeat-containing protein alpha
LSAGDYVKAADLYKQAISFSSDGPNSHIYYSNHAAALMYLGKFNEVIDNCEKSIALKPSYSKAYSRMGAAQIQLKDYDGAIETFRRGLEVDPSNDACKDGLAEAEHKLRASSAPATRSTGAGAGPASGGMPDLGGLASMLGGAGGGGLADLMNNPAMRQMAQNMMQNPAMMQMAQNMMQNPDALNSMMNGLGSLGGGLGGVGAGAPGASAGGAGGMPDIASMMNNFRNSPEVLAARNDPDLQDFFNDVDREGPSAAMRHMSNPKVSQLLQSIMGRVG